MNTTTTTNNIQNEHGLVLAARFSLYTNDFVTANRLSERIASGVKECHRATPIEQEALSVFHWAAFYLCTDVKERKRQVKQLHVFIEDCLGTDLMELDLAVCCAYSYTRLGDLENAVNILNKVITIKKNILIFTEM